MDGAGQPAADDLSQIGCEQRAANNHSCDSYPSRWQQGEQAIDPEGLLHGWKCAFAELTLLLPSRQLLALERAAALGGMTTGQLLRRLIHGRLTELKLLPPQKPTLPDVAAVAICTNPANFGDHLVSNGEA
jgi:hypothetical protein